MIIAFDYAWFMSALCVYVCVRVFFSAAIKKGTLFKIWSYSWKGFSYNIITTFEIAHTVPHSADCYDGVLKLTWDVCCFLSKWWSSITTCMETTMHGNQQNIRAYSRKKIWIPYNVWTKKVMKTVREVREGRWKITFYCLPSTLASASKFI